MNTSFERATMKDEWLTPRHVLAALAPFDLDPCAPEVRPWPMAAKHFTRADDGLAQPWPADAFVWCNPPYGRETAKWFRRMREHNNGIALTFARTETKMFFENVWGGGDAILFLQGRLIFLDTEGKPKLDKHGRPQGAGAPSVLIGYGATAARRLAQCNLPGKFIQLKPINS